MTICIADQIEVMKAALAGKPIQHRSRGLTQWSTARYLPVNFRFDFDNFEFRISPPEPKKVMHRAYIAEIDGCVFLFCGDAPAKGYLRAPWLDGEVEE